MFAFHPDHRVCNSMNWKTCCWTALLSMVLLSAASPASAQFGGAALPLTRARVFVPAQPAAQGQPLTPTAVMAMQEAAAGRSPAASSSAASSADPVAAWEQQRLTKIKQLK